MATPCTLEKAIYAFISLSAVRSVYRRVRVEFLYLLIEEFGFILAVPGRFARESVAVLQY